MIRWAIVTGEYPSQPGGIADYTQLLAAGLAAAGDAVTVYAPPAVDDTSADRGVTVVRLPDHFGPRGLMALDGAVCRQASPDRLLVQYVPHAYGWKAMNLPFAAWLAGRARRAVPVWVMFHEVMYPIERGQPLRHAVLGRVTQTMARLLARSADRVFVSIPAWALLLREICGPAQPAEWLPVPSNVPTVTDSARVAQVRSRVAGPEGIVIGHFGTFGRMNAPLLGPPLASLLGQSSDRLALLVGRNSEHFRERFIVEHPDLAGRVLATGGLTAVDVSAHLAACDILIQPFPDGVSSRRTSVMAGIALAVPIVTNTGRLSEPIWGAESEGLAVARSAAPADLVDAAEAVLALPASEREARGQAAAAWYRSRFAVENTIACLRSDPATSL